MTQTAPYLCNWMMAFNYHRAHGWSHTHHLEVAACNLTNVGARSDTSCYSLWGFLLTGCDDTTTDLKQQTLQHHIYCTCDKFFVTKLQSLGVVGQQFQNHSFNNIITIIDIYRCCKGIITCKPLNRIVCLMLITCLWELAVPPSEPWTIVVGGCISALDTGAPEPT